MQELPQILFGDSRPKTKITAYVVPSEADTCFKSPEGVYLVPSPLLPEAKSRMTLGR